MADESEPESGSFELYDLRVECIEINGDDVASYDVGDYFEVRGEELVFPDGQGFSMYALASLLPLLPAKQRKTHPNDWMTTDTRVAGPDPNVSGVFRITRIDERTFDHGNVSGESLDDPSPVE